MNEEVSKEDQDWLDALSGKSPDGIDPLIAAQAAAVRSAMISRREAIESDAIRLGDSGLNEIRARLQREGLIDAHKEDQRKNTWWARAIDLLGFGPNGVSAKAFPVWGVAATLVVAVLVTFQMNGPQSDESLVYRGDATTTTLIVENPEFRANEIIAGVQAVNADGVEMTRHKDGRIQLQIKESEGVSDYLLSQRIEATAVKGMIKIDIVPVKK